MKDEVVNEVRQGREQNAAKFNCDFMFILD